MTAETDIAAIDDGGANTAAEVRTALTSLLSPGWVRALQAPESAHADDQEFTGTIGGTAVTPTGTATWTQSNGLLSVLATGQSSGDIAPRLYALTSPAAALTIETRVRAMLSSTQFPMVGLVFADGTAASSNAVAFCAYKNNTAGVGEIRSGTLTNMATSAGSIGDAMDGQGNHLDLYLRLTWAASNSFGVEISVDGVTWHDYGYGNKAATLTPTHMGVFASAYGSANDTLASFEYLRRS